MLCGLTSRWQAGPCAAGAADAGEVNIASIEEQEIQRAHKELEEARAAELAEQVR